MSQEKLSPKEQKLKEKFERLSREYYDIRKQIHSLQSKKNLSEDERKELRSLEKELEKKEGEFTSRIGISVISKDGEKLKQPYDIYGGAALAVKRKTEGKYAKRTEDTSPDKQKVNEEEVDNEHETDLVIELNNTDAEIAQLQADKNKIIKRGILDNEVLSEIEEELSNLYDKRKRIVSKLNTLRESVQAEMNEAIEKGQELKNRIPELKRRLKVLKEEIKSIHKSIDSIDRERKKIWRLLNGNLHNRTKKALQSKLKKLDTDRKQLLNDLQDKYKEEKEIEGYIKIYDPEKERLEKELKEKTQNSIERWKDIIIGQAAEGFNTDRWNSAREFVESMPKHKRLILYGVVGASVAASVAGASFGLSALGVGGALMVAGKFGAGVLTHMGLRKILSDKMDRAKAAAGYEKALKKMRLNREKALLRALKKGGAENLSFEKAQEYIRRGKKGSEIKMALASSVFTLAAGSIYHSDAISNTFVSVKDKLWNLWFGIENMPADIDTSEIRLTDEIVNPAATPTVPDIDTETVRLSNEIANPAPVEVADTNSFFEMQATDWASRVKDNLLSLSPGLDNMISMTEGFHDVALKGAQEFGISLTDNDARWFGEFITQGLGASGFSAPGAAEVLYNLGVTDINQIEASKVYDLKAVFTNDEFVNWLKDKIANDPRIQNPEATEKILSKFIELAKS